MLGNRHWSWFHCERLIETIDASLLPGGVVIISEADRANIQKGIVGNFIPLHAGRYEVVYQGRFGCGQARPVLVLRKLRDLDSSVTTALRNASRVLFGGTVTLSHEMDRRLVTKSATALRFGAGSENMVSHIIVPVRNVKMNSLRDDRYRHRFPNYYVSEYRTPEIRLSRLRDGIVFSRLPTCIAATDGTLFLTSYSLSDYFERAGLSDGERRKIAARRDSGDCYLSGFQLAPSILRDGIPELTNYLEQPVFYFGIRWMNMYSHFLYEACPQISLWKTHLRPLGVKLLVHPLMTVWQRDALQSLGVGDEDMVPYAPNSTLMCRELWFSNSFEDGRWSILPEITDFADRTALSDRTRPRTLKVYAARTDTRNRRLVNEQELIVRLEQEGFVTVVGGQHTLAEQISIFEQADIIVGKDGTNLTNIIFGDDKTLLVEILGEEFFEPQYLRIANIRGMHYDHVLASSVSGAKRDADHVVDVEAVVATVNQAMQRRREAGAARQG